MRRKEEFRKCLLGGDQVRGGGGGEAWEMVKKGRGKDRERGRGPKHRLLRVGRAEGRKRDFTRPSKDLPVFGGVWRCLVVHLPVPQSGHALPVPTTTSGLPTGLLPVPPFYRTESTRRNKFKR
jgi:hypothetical protein